MTQISVSFQYKIFSLSAAAKQVLHMELLQYVIGCVFCETLSPQGTMIFVTYIFVKNARKKHISDKSKEHIHVHVIMSFEMRKSTPKWSIHSTEICARCKQRNTSICALYDSLILVNINATKQSTYLKCLMARKNAGTMLWIKQLLWNVMLRFFFG